MTLHDLATLSTLAGLPMPSESDGGDLENPPHAPVPAVSHLANRRTPDVWDRMTVSEQRDHADACPNLCDVCDGRRAFGTCTHCGAAAEETGEYDVSRCCGSLVVFGGEAA